MIRVVLVGMLVLAVGDIVLLMVAAHYKRRGDRKAAENAELEDKCSALRSNLNVLRDEMEMRNENRKKADERVSAMHNGTDAERIDAALSVLQDGGN